MPRYALMSDTRTPCIITRDCAAVVLSSGPYLTSSCFAFVCVQIVRLAGTYTDGTSTFKIQTIGTNKIIMTDKASKVIAKGSYDGRAISIDGKEGTGSVLGVKFSDGSSWKKI